MDHCLLNTLPSAVVGVVTLKVVVVAVAGGFVTGPETANDSTSYTVTIGAGGRGGSPPSPAFLNGARGMTLLSQGQVSL